MLRVVCALVAVVILIPTAAQAELQVGAAVVDVSPTQLTVLVNGGMTSRSISEIKTRINARAIVCSDGQERSGSIRVDRCMMNR